MITHAKLKTKGGFVYDNRVYGLVLNERGLWFDEPLKSDSDELHSRGFVLTDLESLAITITAEDDDDLPF